MSKILRSNFLKNLEVYQPEIKITEEERFCPLFPQERDFLQVEKSENLEKDLEKEEGPSQEEIFKRAYEEGLKRGREEGFKRGYEEGFERGKEEGLKRGLDEAKERLEEERKRLFKEIEEEKEKELGRLRELLEGLEEEIKSTVLSLDEGILKLSLKIAQKLLFKEVKTDQELLLRIIREALKYLAEGIEVVIRINPEDYRFLEESKVLLPRNYHFKILPDEGVKRGGAVLESQMGVIDATLEKRWEMVLKALEDEG